jgi:hypothetical protein
MNEDHRQLAERCIRLVALIIFDAGNLAVAADPSTTLTTKAAAVSSRHTDHLPRWLLRELALARG